MHISVIIPTKGHEALLRDCVSTLTRHHDGLGIDYEVIIVDDGSEVPIEGLIGDSLGPRVRHCRLEQNSGFSTACNFGANHALADKIVFLNNDTRSYQPWLGSMIIALDDPKVGVVGAALFHNEDELSCQHYGACLSEGANVCHFYFGASIDELPLEEGAFVCSAVTGAVFGVSKRDFQALSGFDQVYLNGYEDIDFCLRMTRRFGKLCIVDASCRLVHLEGRTEGRRHHESANATRFYWQHHARCRDLVHTVELSNGGLSLVPDVPVYYQYGPLT